MAVINQIVTTAIISYVCTTLGLFYTLPSYTFKLFTSENTTLDRMMTYAEISFMGSLSQASSFLITPLSWYLLNKLGRKRILILFYLPQLLGWIILATINKVEAVLFSMFLSGLSGCSFLIIPIFVSEYCEVSVRGSMTSSAIIFYELGIMISYVFGGFLEYTTIKYVCLIMSSLGLCLLCYIRESPLYLIKKGLDEEAAKSIGFYRGLKNNSKEVSRQIESIRSILKFELENNDTTEEERLNPDAASQENISIWKILSKSRTIRYALTMLLIVETSSIFQGLIVVQVYAKPLLEATVPVMSSTLAAVLLAVIIAVSSFIGAYLVDTIGRRPLLIIAATASGFCCVVLGTQVQLVWGPNWITAVFMNLYFLFYILGAGTVPYVLASELFLPETKMFTTVVFLEWGFICNFILLFIFHPLEMALGLGVIFYLFAVFSFITALATFILIPETMGLSIEAIQLKLLRKRK